MAGWETNETDCLALKINTYLVYVNFSATAQRVLPVGVYESS